MTAEIISDRLLEELLNSAEASPRRRQHLNLHAEFGDPCQRFLNAICSGSYIRPHRHSVDPKIECLFAVKGVLGVILFNDAGNVIDTQRIAPLGATSVSDGSVAIQITPSSWHTVVSLTPQSILLEMKAGPFDPTAAKEPAAWSPCEQTPEASSYLEELVRLF